MPGFGEEMAGQGRIAKIARIEMYDFTECNVTSPFGLYIYLYLSAYLFSIYLCIVIVIVIFISIFFYLFIYIYIYI